jgi:hypothetical protein
MVQHRLDERSVLEFHNDPDDFYRYPDPDDYEGPLD